MRSCLKYVHQTATRQNQLACCLFLSLYCPCRRICPKVRMRVKLYAAIVSANIWSTRPSPRTIT